MPNENIPLEIDNKYIKDYISEQEKMKIANDVLNKVYSGDIDLVEEYNKLYNIETKEEKKTI